VDFATARRRLVLIGLAFCAAAGMITGGVALASGSGAVIHGCVNKTTKVLRIATHCTKHETAIS